MHNEYGKPAHLMCIGDFSDLGFQHVVIFSTSECKKNEEFYIIYWQVPYKYVYFFIFWGGGEMEGFSAKRKAEKY